MQPEVILREKTTAASNLLDLTQIAGDNPDPRSNPISIAPGADGLDQDGIRGVAAVVPQQLRCAIKIIDQHVDIAIIIYIAKSGAPADPRFQEWGARLRGYLGEGSVAIVLVKQLPLAVWLSLRVGVAISDQQVDPTIVVIVKEPGAQPT